MSAAELERLWRGHWVIENRVHYVRDVTLGEDGGQAYRGNTPHALAILRNTLLNVLRGRGWKRIADALRHDGAAVERAVAYWCSPSQPVTSPWVAPPSSVSRC